MTLEEAAEFTASRMSKIVNNMVAALVINVGPEPVVIAAVEMAKLAHADNALPGKHDPEVQAILDECVRKLHDYIDKKLSNETK